MKLMVAANLDIGGNTLPPMFARKLADTAVLRKYERLCLINVFAPAKEHWRQIASQDFKDTLGDFSPLWRMAGVTDLTLVFGPHDRFLDWRDFRKVRESLEQHGITILREPTNELDGVIVTSGYADMFNAPSEPSRWLGDMLGVTRQPLTDRERRGVRRENLSDYADWAARRGFPVTVHGLPGLPSWGRVGDSWFGGPATAPNVLMLDTARPQDGQIVRL